MKLITYPAIVKLLLCKLFTNLINIYYIKIPVHNTLKDYESMPIGITGIQYYILGTFLWIIINIISKCPLINGLYFIPTNVIMAKMLLIFYNLS